MKQLNKDTKHGGFEAAPMGSTKLWWLALCLAALLLPAGIAAQTTVAGELAQDFTVIGFESGEIIRMSDFEGQILILDFFAYWCIHCKSSAPDLETNVRQTFEARGGNVDGLPVTILSISIEPRELPQTAAFIAEHGVALAANDFAGIDSNAWQQFGATYIPHFVVINGVAGSHTHQQWEVLLSEAGYKGAETMRSLVNSIRKDAQAAKPVITDQPMDTMIEAGEGFNLSVLAQAEGPVSFQWLHDGLPIEGALDSSYRVACGQTFHAGDYSVIVSAGEGLDVISDVASVLVNPAAASDARLMNLSTRGLCLAGDQILIPGFVIAGSETKRLLIRAVGPTLGEAPFHLPAVLSDPMMTLKRWNSSLGSFVDVAVNDDWALNTNTAEILSTTSALGGFTLTNDKDAVLLVDLEPGRYTVATEGVNGATGLSMVELYDAEPSATGTELLNISNRGFAGEGDEVMIPGFVVSDHGPRTFLIRVVGPTLGQEPFHVPDTLSDPQLAVYRREASGADSYLFGNDDWSDNPDAATTVLESESVGAFALDPDSGDAALVVTLPPGAYTVVGSSAVPGETGVILVEVYAVPAAP